MITHFGDYLVFAGLGSSVGLDLPIARCEVEPGIFRRHWLPFESRSDISRDGYLGVLHYIAAKNDMAMLNRILHAGWKRGWTMGDRGDWDYVNMLPLVPLMYMLKYGGWFPTIPTICVGKMKTGFRAHLLAITILLELRAGKKSFWHKWSMRRLVKYNPENPMFLALLNYIENKDNLLVDFHIDLEYCKWEEGCFGWGSCPPEVFYRVTKFIINMERVK